MLHEELWRYADQRLSAVVFRASESLGRLSITRPSQPAVMLIVPLGPDSPTPEDDEDWMTTVLNYSEDET